jgi:hypothetical protein
MLPSRLSALLTFTVAALVAFAFVVGAVVQPARSLSAAAQQGQSRTEEEEEREKGVDGAEEQIALGRPGHDGRTRLVPPRGRRLLRGPRPGLRSGKATASPVRARARAPERRQL